MIDKTTKWSEAK